MHLDDTASTVLKNRTRKVWFSRRPSKGSQCVSLLGQWLECWPLPVMTDNCHHLIIFCQLNKTNDCGPRAICPQHSIIITIKPHPTSQAPWGKMMAGQMDRNIPILQKSILILNNAGMPKFDIYLLSEKRGSYHFFLSVEDYFPFLWLLGLSRN